LSFQSEPSSSLERRSDEMTKKPEGLSRSYVASRQTRITSNSKGP
jgi:hypothetical protein